MLHSGNLALPSLGERRSLSPSWHKLGAEQPSRLRLEVPRPAATAEHRRDRCRH